MSFHPPVYKKYKPNSFPSHCNQTKNTHVQEVNLYDDILNKIIQINALQKESAEAEVLKQSYNDKIEALQAQPHVGAKQLKVVQKEYESLLKKRDKIQSGFKITIYIDNREGRNNDLFSSFDQLAPGIVHKLNLFSLDFIITLNDKFAFGFERKRLDDAVASTQSSHYTAQNCRMKYLFKQHIGQEHSRIVNILEKIRLQSEQECTCVADEEEVLDRINTNLSRFMSMYTRSNDSVMTTYIETFLKSINEYVLNSSSSDYKTCTDDKMYLISEEKSFDHLSLNRDRVLGIPINRMIKEGFNTIQSESDQYTAFWLLKIMLSLLKNGTEMMKRWGHQPDFHPDSMQEAEQALSGEPLKEWINTRELPKEKDVLHLSLTVAQRAWALQLLVLKNVTIDYVWIMVQRWKNPLEFIKFAQSCDTTQTVIDVLRSLCPGEGAKEFGAKRAVDVYNHFFGTQYGVNKKGQIVAAITEEEEVEESDI